MCPEFWVHIIAGGFFVSEVSPPQPAKAINGKNTTVTSKEEI